MIQVGDVIEHKFMYDEDTAGTVLAKVVAMSDTTVTTEFETVVKRNDIVSHYAKTVYR